MPEHLSTVLVERLLSSDTNSVMKCPVMFWQSVWPTSTRFIHKEFVFLSFPRGYVNIRQKMR